MSLLSQPPRTQYDRNLTIRIQGGGPDGYISFTFPIKPKEFQRDTPVRMSTTQTLGGVYQDFGGLGVTTLVYSGHTGWRRIAPKGPYDGWEVFKSLYENIFKEYHKRIQNSGDPESVNCIVIDDLFDTVYRVSLDDMQATKSASAPLLYNYSLKMTALDTSVDNRDPVDYIGLSLLTMSDSGAASNNVAQQVAQAMQTTASYVPPPVRTYKVQPGDNLWTLAQTYYGDGTQDIKIAQANGIKPPAYTIYAGQILTIPN